MSKDKASEELVKTIEERQQQKKIDKNINETIKKIERKSKEIKYYSPERILRMRDLDNLKPAIYLINTNRSAGKTFSFLKLVLQNFKDSGKQVALLYRHSYELKSCGAIFTDVLSLNPELGISIKSVPHANGLFYEMFLDEVSFGFALTLNNPDALKKYSPLFAHVDDMIFDEYQTETGKYLPKEIDKFQSLYLTVARGGGKQSRHVNVYLLGNNVTLMNPYYIQFGIHKRLRTDTKFMKGNGWVAEFGFNESASREIKSNAFFQAFADESYMSYSTENVYLSDSSIFVGKLKGRSKYLFTILHDNTNYGVREFYDDGMMYVSKNFDPSCATKVTFKPSDHNQNTMMLNHYSYLWKNIKDSYQKGWLRFDDLKTKSDIFDILAIDLYK